MSGSGAGELNALRKRLNESLGENFAQYMTFLRNWFCRKSTKEEFDREARKLLSQDTVHIHNQFLIAVLNKCQSLVSYMPTTLSSDYRSSEPGGAKSQLGPAERIKKGKLKKKNKSSKSSIDQRFQTTQLIESAPEISDTLLRPEERNIAFATRDGTLPDIGLIHGRMLVAAWEDGVEGCDDQAVSLTMAAVQHFLRNIITALLSSRNSWRQREGMKHSIGCPVPNPWLINTQRKRKICGYSTAATEATLLNEAGLAPASRPEADRAEAEALYELSLGIHRRKDLNRSPLSLFDLLKVLKEDRDVIPNHTIYSLNVERIIMRLHHEERPE